MIERIGVLIPARNEEERIVGCLESVREASCRVDIPVSIVVVADGCDDRTATLARASGATVLEIPASGVGAARAVAAQIAIAAGCDWLASTDADTLVPHEWLTTQLALAASGADVVLGTVRPDFGDLSLVQRRAWHDTHGEREELGSIHGANLGVRSSSYLAAGGFHPVLEHEDVDLVRRLAQWRVVSTAHGEVITSGRSLGRTPGGFARYLQEDLLAFSKDPDGAVA